MPAGATQHLLTCALNSAIVPPARFDLFSLGGAARLPDVSVGRLSIQASRAAVATRSSALAGAPDSELLLGTGFWLASGPGLIGSGLSGSGLGGAGLGGAGLGGAGRGGSDLASSDFGSSDLASSDLGGSGSAARGTSCWGTISTRTGSAL